MTAFARFRIARSEGKHTRLCHANLFSHTRFISIARCYVFSFSCKLAIARNSDGFACNFPLLASAVLLHGKNSSEPDLATEHMLHCLVRIIKLELLYHAMDAVRHGEAARVLVLAT